MHIKFAIHPKECRCFPTSRCYYVTTFDVV